MEASLNGLHGRVALGTTPLTIGRAAQLVVDDPSISLQHAEVRPTGQEYRIVDLGSTSGTFLNGQQLPPHLPVLLQSGDLIRIADTTFTYAISSASQITPTQGSAPAYQPTVAATPFPYTSYNSGVPSPYAAQPNATGYVMPTQQKSRRGLWIILGIIAAVLLVGGVIIVNLPSPSKTLDTFCSALMHDDGQTIYNQLSPRLRVGISPEELTASFNRNIDTSKVTSCTHNTPSVSGNTATAHLTFVYASGRIENYQILLIQESGNSWKIDNLQSTPG